MKRVILLLIGWCIVGYTSSAAQDMSNVFSLYNQKSDVQKFIPLKESLKILEDEYDVTFIYKNYLVENKKVLRTAIVAVSFQAALTQILESSNLTYEQIGSRNFLLLPIDKPVHIRLFEIIRGMVADASTGETLPGVNIAIKGTTTGTSTDAQGRFELNVPSLSDTLIFSFIGYETREVPVNGRTEITVALQPTTISGEEIVVVGYGSTRRKDLTGSVSSVSAEEMRNAVATTFDQALQGRTAGVMVMKNSGKPGAGISIQIRGVNTLSSNSEPLYVIDGIPISGDSDDGFMNPLATLNPDDIQSIDILKDASAAAIYGAQAANGVVIITTKRGEAGQTNVDYNAYLGFQQLPKKVDVMNLQQYAEYRNKQTELIGWGSQPEFANPSLLGEGTDWQEELFRTSPMTKHTLSVSGGNKQTQYFLSAGYFNQEGIAIGSDFRRYSIRMNLDNQPTSWLKVGTSMNLSQTNENLNVTSADIVSLAIRQTPDIPVKYSDGSWGGPSQSEFTLENPVGLAELNSNSRKRSQVLGNLFAEIDILDNLTLRNELNGTFGYTNEYVFNPTYEFNARSSDLNSSSRSAGNNTFWQIKNYLTYVNSLQRIDINAVAGHEVQVSSWEGLSGARDRFPSNNVSELSAGDASTATNSSYAGSNSLQSIFGRVNLTYDDRYLLTATVRGDASSQFGSNNRWGVFPSFAAAWRISNERFMQGIDFISELKLRAGYGFVGNQNIGNYLYGSTLSVVPTEWGNGVLPNNLANPDLKWESTESVNIGLDLSVLDQRINFTVDAYIKRTHDLLLALPLPLYAGASTDWTAGRISAPTINIGSLENKGLEFAVNTVNVSGPFRWETDLVLSMNRNEVTRMNRESSLIERVINFDEVITRTEVGIPVGQFYGYVVDGMFLDEEDIRNHAKQTDDINPTDGVWVGDLKFRDLNEDGVIDSNDRTFIGNPMPDFQYGVTNRFFYKNFDLSVFINGNYGNKIFNQVKRQNEYPGSNFGLLASVYDYARIGLKDPNGSTTDISNVYITNPETDVPRITAKGTDPNNNQRISDRFIEDGTYLRIQNITLGYSLPIDILSKVHLRNLRIYASVENLHTFTGYSGYDPEIGSETSDPLLMGVDQGRYPSPRIFTFGISLGL